MTSTLLVVKIWDTTRTIKKSFVFTGQLSTIIEKANAAGIDGSKLVLESDGTEIDDAEVFQYYGEKNDIFQLYPTSGKWTLAPSLENKNETIKAEQQSMADVDTNNDVVNWINTSVKANTISTLEYVELPNSPLSSTISMSSGRISSLNSDKSDNIGVVSAQKLFAGYQIPYHKMPDELTGLLNDQKPLGRYYTDFVHTIVTDMLQISFYIPQTIFRKIADHVVLLFPKSLGVLNSAGELVSDESVGLATKMINHNTYLNRSEKSVMKTKRNINISEGVPNFCAKDIEVYPGEESEAKRIWLKEHFKMEISNDELKEEIITVFRNTFATQRKYLMQDPKIIEVRQSWPHLLSPYFMKIHFERLMDLKETTFEERWENLKIKTNQFSQKKKTQYQCSSTDDDLKVLEIITQHFKENLELMIRQYPAGTTQNEIEPLDATPCFSII